MVTQVIRLRSREHYGRRAPAKDTGTLLRVLPDAVKLSVRMALEGRSVGRKRPRWLQKASDLRFVGIGGEDDTLLTFELPALGEAAPELFSQLSILDSLDDGEGLTRREQTSADTGIDLLADVFSDISNRKTDSTRFDPKLLEFVAGLRKFLGDQYYGFDLERRGQIDPVMVNGDVIEQARTLYTNVPVPRRVRIVGRLDMVRASTQSFGVILDDGQEVRGVLTEGEIESVSGLLKQRVQMLGKAIYRPSGRLLRVDAEEVSATTESGSFFSAIPKPSRKRFDLREVVRDQSGKNGIAAIIGKWPGDETDEEVSAALNELS